MKISDIIEGLLPHTEEDDKYLEGVMQRSYEISQSRGVIPITRLGGLDVIATQWPPKLWTFVFFMDAGQPVGFAKLWEGGRDSTPAEDDRIAVSIIWFRPEYRGRGIGRAFYDFMGAEGVRLKPDVKQTAGGAALWKGRTPAPLGESEFRVPPSAVLSVKRIM